MKYKGFCFAALLCLNTLVNHSALAERLTFMTGPAGGTWYPLGGAVKQLLEQEIEGLKIVVRPGAGLINIKGISTGKTDIAWGNVISTVDAVNGHPPFEQPIKNLCNLAAFYYQYAQIPVIDANILSIAQLHGMSIATLPRGNTTEVAARSILSIYGLIYDDLRKVNFVSVTDQINMMKDGQIEAFILATSLPAAGIIDLASARNIRLLPIDEEKFQLLYRKNPGWSRALIPANTYPGQSEDVPTASFQMHLMAHCNKVSELTAYKIVKAIAQRGAELSAVTATLDGYNIEVMSKYVGVPFHSGAKLFYDERGFTTSR